MKDEPSDLDRRRPRSPDILFEAPEDYDFTSSRVFMVIDQGEGVEVWFCEDGQTFDSQIIVARIYLRVDQCRELGDLLVKHAVSNGG